MTDKIKHLEPGRPARSGQLILERRYRIVSSLLGAGTSWGRVLDIGCGNGAQSIHFQPDSKMVVGMDVMPESGIEGLVQAKDLYRIQGSALELPFRSECFDTITCFEVLEHLPDDETAVAEVRRALSRNGLFIMSVPNRWWIFESHGAVVPGFNWIPWNRVPLMSWLPTRIHDRFAKARIYRMREMLGLLRKNGFDPIHSGYITAPLDVLPDGFIRWLLRSTLFRGDVTRNPMLAVNLFIIARKK